MADEKRPAPTAAQPKTEDDYDEVIDEILEEDGSVNVGSLLENIVQQALQHKSSDIHIEPLEDKIVVRYRIDGLLRQAMEMDKSVEDPLVFKVKVSARLRTDEHFAPQDGKIRFDFENEKVDARVSILPTTKGEKIVMRLLTQTGKSFALEDLGFQDEQLEAVNKSFRKPYGMILASGPTGSGKTTTLYSILKILRSPEINITTIEDPVEYDVDGINHVQVNTKADLTFANGLRSLLRQDPDVLMIGEIRDAETARIATNAAMTGHLVLSTIHTNDAITTIPRLIDMDVERFLVSSTLNVVIAQRLARKLCNDCKKEFTVSPEYKTDLARFRSDVADAIKLKEKFYKAVGCAKCNDTGYKGRVGLYEVLEVDKELREMIAEGASTDDIFDKAKKMGLILILDDGFKKARAGLVSIEEIVRVTAIKE